MNERLRLLHAALGLTNAEFASRLGGLTRAAVNAWENGAKIPRRQQARICEEFGVNPDWLATGEGEMFTRPVDPEVLERLETIKNESKTKSGRLRILRRQLGLTLSQFGARIGLKGAGMLSTWERGSDKIPTAWQAIICETFGVNPTWFETGEGEMYSFELKPDVPFNAVAATELARRALDALPPDVQQLVLEVARRVVAARTPDNE